MCQATRHTAEYLSIYAVANLWLASGGSETNIVAAVAVAWAESEQLNRFALSPACALGLWQIIEAHATERGLPVEQLYDARTNAGIAVEMSQDGTEWRDWDVAYAEGSALRQRRHIAYPEPGSVAYAAIAIVAPVLGSTGGGGGGGGSGGGGGNPGTAGRLSNPPGVVLVGFTDPIPWTGAPNGPELPDLANPAQYGDGWENYAHYVTTDIRYLTEVDARVVNDILHY